MQPQKLQPNEYIWNDKILHSKNNQYSLEGSLKNQMSAIQDITNSPTLFLTANFFHHPDITHWIQSKCNKTFLLLHYFDQWLNKDTVDEQLNKDLIFFSIGIFCPNKTNIPNHINYNSIHILFLYIFSTRNQQY